MLFDDLALGIGDGRDESAPVRIVELKVVLGAVGVSDLCQAAGGVVLVGAEGADGIGDAGTKAREGPIGVVEGEQPTGGIGDAGDSVLVGGIDADVDTVAVRVNEGRETAVAVEDVLRAVELGDNPLRGR